ncbi:MAG: 30S ribosomal protein S3 [Dehalococcoidales bacterium]
MGHKVHPTGFRIGVIRDWQAKWYADKHYSEFLHEDLKLRQAIQSWYAEAGVSQVEIHRQANKVAITIYTARPGILIGRGGQRVDEMRLRLDDLTGKRVQLNIQEIRQPELDAYLVAKTIAEQIEHRVAYRRAMKQAVLRTTQAGAKGMRISCAGRLGGAEIARRQTIHQGQVPLHKLRADIDYGFAEARTTMGRIGVKVWIYKGDILPEPKVEVAEEMIAEPATAVSPKAEPAEAAAAISPEAEPAVEPEKKPVTRRKKAAPPAPVKAEAEPAVEEEGKDVTTQAS